MRHIQRIVELILDLTPQEQEILWSKLGRVGLASSVLNPQIALEIVRARPEKSSLFREILCKDPHTALDFAMFIEKSPSDDTRAAACKDPECAYRYADDVDECPRDDTRTAACGNASPAMWYAKNVDKGPHPETRQACLQYPQYAYSYAHEIDRGPRDDTRTAACRHSNSNHGAALNAVLYALEVDEGYHPETWGSVKGTDSQEFYLQHIQDIPPEIREEIF